MHGLVHFCWSLKNLLVLIYSKLHSKSCDYPYKDVIYIKEGKLSQVLKEKPKKLVRWLCQGKLTFKGGLSSSGFLELT